MSGSSFGTLFRITTWGESHGTAIGVVIDGCPAGLPLCETNIQAFLDRRRPGQSRYTTKRSESDQVKFSPVSLKAEQPGLLFPFSYAIRISVPGIMEKLLPITDRDMPITHSAVNMVFAIIAAAAAHPAGKPSDALLPELLLLPF